ncbi:uncharacterized protein [Pagrus major]|uniref:uncharacterized protein n=1 Tax=Pagrus major TaxID=143350 RepID=UPI003CC88457
MVARLGQLSSQVRELADHLRQTARPPVAPESPAAAAAPTQGAPMTGMGIKLAPPERFSGEPGQYFKTALMRTFDPVSTDREKARELSRLTQGRDSVCDYAIRFHTLAVESGWNNTTLYDVFLKGLAAHIQQLLLLPLDLPADLDSLISLAIRTDNRVCELRQPRSSGSMSERSPRSPAPGGQAPRYSPPEHCLPSPTAREEELMQLGRTRLTPEER